MKYFTPELYLRFNSRDRKIVEKAHAQWEEALVKYRQHLAHIAPRLTPSTRNIAETLCLHDAEYLGLSLPQFERPDNSLAVLSTRREATSVLLVYVLAEEPLIQQVSQKWPYSQEAVHWLYDEFDLSDGVQQHEVLLSNGCVLTLRFYEMQQIRHDIHTPSAVA